MYRLCDIYCALCGLHVSPAASSWLAFVQCVLDGDCLHPRHELTNFRGWGREGKGRGGDGRKEMVGHPSLFVEISQFELEDWGTWVLQAVIHTMSRSTVVWLAYAGLWPLTIFGGLHTVFPRQRYPMNRYMRFEGKRSLSQMLQYGRQVVYHLLLAICEV